MVSSHVTAQQAQVSPSWRDRIALALKDIRWCGFCEKSGEALIPLVAQDASTGQVLMQGYVSRAALERTCDEGSVVFHSRSKGRLWKKGETSGATLTVVDLYFDCDTDAVLALVEPQGPTCHRGTTTCFDKQDAVAVGDAVGKTEVLPPFVMLGKLARTIAARSNAGEPESYTRKLLEAGLDRVAKKVGEECTEVILAAKNAQAQGDTCEFVNESADLIYHWLVMCESLGVEWQDVARTLQARIDAPRREAKPTGSV